MRPLRHKPISLPTLATKIGPDDDHDERQARRLSRLYRDLWRATRDNWYDTARTYEANPGSVYNAWRYLNDHPIFWKLTRWPTDEDRGLPREHARYLIDDQGMDLVEIGPHRVNPDDRRVSEDKALNTRLEWWAESGEWGWSDDPVNRYHNYKLDCGGATYEEAVIAMARKVWKHYGNDRRKCAPQFHEEQRERRNKRLKKQFGPNVGMTRERPYGHRCGWERLPGLAGALQDADEITRSLSS